MKHTKLIGMVLCMIVLAASFTDARQYQPITGRFTQRDPIEYEGGINLYTYAQNSPANYKDPSGMSTELCINLVSGFFPMPHTSIKIDSRHGKGQWGFAPKFPLEVKATGFTGEIQKESGGICVTIAPSDDSVTQDCFEKYLISLIKRYKQNPPNWSPGYNCISWSTQVVSQATDLSLQDPTCRKKLADVPYTQSASLHWDPSAESQRLHRERGRLGPYR